MSIIRSVYVLGLLLLSFQVLADPLKIACVGDSITQGSGLGNAAVESYPAKLQRLLGTNYIVRNYGVSGRTLLKEGDYPYWKEPSFKQSHDWLPDVVIIQLGTNDSKPYNWRYGTNYVAEYEEMIASYGSLTNSPRVILCTPCPVFGNGNYDIVPGTVRTNIAPAVRDIAARLELDMLDLHERFAGHKEWFPDNVHPNTKGTTVMAAMMLGAVLPAATNQPIPSVDIQQISSTRIALGWPASWRGLVPLSTTTIAASNAVWIVAEPVIYLDGEGVRQTNTMSGANRLFRLWAP